MQVIPVRQDAGCLATRAVSRIRHFHWANNVVARSRISSSVSLRNTLDNMYITGRILVAPTMGMKLIRFNRLSKNVIRPTRHLAMTVAAIDREGRPDFVACFAGINVYCISAHARLSELKDG
jgi:hypothetical protein